LVIESPSSTVSSVARKIPTAPETSTLIAIGPAPRWWPTMLAVAIAAAIVYAGSPTLRRLAIEIPRTPRSNVVGIRSAISSITGTVNSSPIV
jgi:hypothetical protein